MQRGVEQADEYWKTLNLTLLRRESVVLHKKSPKGTCRCDQGVRVCLVCMALVAPAGDAITVWQ